MSEKKQSDQQQKTNMVPNTNAREISEDELELVTGGSNPFGDIPRVPNAKIDQGLRNKA